MGRIRSVAAGTAMALCIIVSTASPTVGAEPEGGGLGGG